MVWFGLLVNPAIEVIERFVSIAMLNPAVLFITNAAM
jgi:hypothetical protein